MNLLIQEFLTQILPADEPSVLEPLLKMARPRHFHKKELLLAEGETPTEIIFIQKGIFRGFFYNVSGKDVTDCFCYRFGEPAVPSLPLDAPANVSMESLTESETVSFPAAPLAEFLSRSSFALRMYNKLLLESLSHHVEVKKMLYQYTAAQKYAWFLEKYPGLDEVIGDKYIASFLGVTPVTLSRSRKALGGTKGGGEKGRL